MWIASCHELLEGSDLWSSNVFSLSGPDEIGLRITFAKGTGTTFQSLIAEPVVKGSVTDFPVPSPSSDSSILLPYLFGLHALGLLLSL